MGFSGGGANILKAHRHDGLVVQDGGSLDFNNITQSNSSAGQIFYSDGVHLQQLAYPGVPAGESLTAVAASTEPSWAPPSAGAWTVEGSDSGTGVSTLSVDVSDKDIYQVQYSVSNGSGSSFETGCTVNNDTGANYDSSVFSINNSAGTGATAFPNQSEIVMSAGGHTKSHYGFIQVYKNQTARTSGVGFRGMETTSAATHGFDYATWAGGTNITITAAVSSIQIRLTGGLTFDGEMKVISMDY